jgi:hypothetical protein
MRNCVVGAMLLTCLAFQGCSGGNSGNSWTEVKAFEDIYSLNDLWVFGPDKVWVVGSAGAVARYDGSDWTTEDTGSFTELTGIWAFATDDIWVVGGAELLHFDGSAWESTDLEALGIRDATGIWGQSSSNLWIVGDQGIVLHHDGDSWDRMVIPCSSNSGIWGFSADDVWTQGVFGTCHFDGNSWQELEPGIPGGEGDVWGSASNDVWVVGESAEAARWDGSDWTVYENNRFIGEMARLWGSASDDLWGVGIPGSIVHFDGNGWVEVKHQTIGAPYLRMFKGVHGSSADNVWVVGAELGADRNCGLVFRYQP